MNHLTQDLSQAQANSHDDTSVPLVSMDHAVLGATAASAATLITSLCWIGKLLLDQTHPDAEPFNTILAAALVGTIIASTTVFSASLVLAALRRSLTTARCKLRLLTVNNATGAVALIASLLAVAAFLALRMPDADPSESPALLADVTQFVADSQFLMLAAAGQFVWWATCLQGYLLTRRMLADVQAQRRDMQARVDSWKAQHQAGHQVDHQMQRKAKRARRPY